MFLDGFLVLIAICTVDFVQAQQYILDPQFHFHPQRDDFYNRNKPLQYQQEFPGFSGFDSYIPQRDLQTSDLPFHLQKTLPQYRFPTKERLPKTELPYQTNVIFRPDHERAKQNIAPSTHRPNYSHFLTKHHNRDPSQSETFLGQITLDNSFGNLDNFYNIQGNKKLDLEKNKPIPEKLLRQHIRILAPDPEDKQNQLQENKYYVNENGEVFSTSEIPSTKYFPPKKLSTKLEIENDSPSQEPPRNNVIDTHKSSFVPKQQDQVFNSANNFDTSDYEYVDEEAFTPDTKQLKSSNAEIPHATNSPKTNDGQTDTNSETSKDLTTNNVNELKNQKVEEPVVSVVTTKSVINNTVFATTPTSTPIFETTTEGVQTSTPNAQNTTDTWVVVASVQTSKSISGAHYLPSSIVAQEERFKLLNEKDRKDTSNEEEISTTEDYSSYEDYDGETTTEQVTTKLPSKHSTESLIDKLDRVQSDLSSGLLTGGYKNEDNNIAVITENMTDKIHMAEMTESPTVPSQIFPSAPKSHFPVIKKFSPHSRPPSSNLYPKRKSLAHRKPFTTPTQSSVEHTGNTNAKADPKITIAKADSFLPPGYKVPTDDNGTDLLSKLIQKFKNANKVNLTENIQGNFKNETFKNESIGESLHRFGPHNSTLAKNDTLGSKSSSKTIPSGIDAVLKIAKAVDIKNFLPPGFKEEAETSTQKTVDSLNKAKVDDVSAFLPPGYKPKVNNSKSSLIDDLLTKTKKDDITSFLPPGFKPETATTKPPQLSIETILKKSKQEDLSALLPPEYKAPSISTTKKPSKIDALLQNSKEDDISAFLPPGYKSKSMSTTQRSKPKFEDIIEKAKQDDISAFLPPGFKPKSYTTRKPTSLKAAIEVENLPTSLLPSGYKPRKENEKPSSSTEQPVATVSMSSTTTKSGLKIVFPSRPGGKRINHKLTTPKSNEEKKEAAQTQGPVIHKGWPTRATTEFTGWPTPSTTPISIEKLLQSVQRATSTSIEPENVTTTTTTQRTAPPSTTTAKTTTPGVCVDECDFVGTIKLVEGVKWVPELLDRNTKKWQLLANEVQTQLEEVYKKSSKLKYLFKKLRIDGFAKGSVLVDYIVEMKNVETHVSTVQMKEIFNEALENYMVKIKPREGKALNETEKNEGKAQLGKFIIDPEYTDFIVSPKQMAPTVGYAEDNLLLPQWAIAVIVIGLASLLFVIIFGVTVLVNRSKNAKKKVPIPLTEEMINELNKNHMGGYDNYAAEDPYSVEAGFWDPRRMDAHREYNRLPKKHSSGSINDNSMTNLYDSWKSQWNGYYNNSTGGYYGNPGPGSSHRLYERRRSYDTNF